MPDIEKLSIRYILYSTLLVILLTVLAFLAEKFGMFDGLMYPVAVSAVYSIVIEGADAIVWCKVAKSSPDSLTTFYTAVSGTRMLSALAVMFVCYIVVGRECVTPYIVVLLIYYFVMLAHHSVFFSRLANGGKLKK